MSELIKKARPKKKARYVCMEGADKLVGNLNIWVAELRLTAISAAQWSLRYFCQAELGHGP